MLTSPQTYDVIRNSGFISRRTLRDYSNCMKIKAGFQHEVLEVLRKEVQVDELPEWKRLFNYLHDHYALTLWY